MLNLMMADVLNNIFLVSKLLLIESIFYLLLCYQIFTNIDKINDMKFWIILFCSQ